MLTTSDRRQDTERRADDRRDSPRVNKQLRVVDGVAALERSGEIGLGGASWLQAAALPTGRVVELSFSLPDLAESVRTAAEVLHCVPVDGGHRVQVRFLELDVKHELALARFLETASRLEEARLTGR
jgi:hypothetical protein